MTVLDAWSESHGFLARSSYGGFRQAGGTPAEYRAGMEHAIARWLWRHEPGAYVKFSPAGAELFA